MSSPVRTLRTPAELASAGLIPPRQIAELDQVAARYAISITPAMVDLVDAADPEDPIALQFVPRAGELGFQREERADPIGDGVHECVPGLIHRYPDRVLLKLVSACAVYCRFCFRREMVGPQKEQTLSGAALDRVLAYIGGRTEIWEVILSGGDPLILSPRRLRRITSALGSIPHVRVLRWHTRLPVAAPERVTDEMISGLRSTAQAVYVALHANHPRELTAAARAACARIVNAGIPMLGQTVLLKGVNDDPETLEALMRALVETRIKPYYLHHADHAPGTSHLRTSIGRGRTLVRGMRGKLSGLCQPTYMLDIPGGYGKVAIAATCLAHVGDGCYMVEDPSGRRHWYHDPAETLDQGPPQADGLP